MSTIAAGTYAIDPSHTEVSFSVRHVGIARVRGTFREVSGSIEIADDLAASSAKASIVAGSVDTGDDKRDAHLRSADFFTSDEHPTWDFTSSEVRSHGDGLTVAGDLTINGVTRPVTLDVEYNGAATDPFGQERIGFSATTTLSRKDFGLTWNVALEGGGVLVGDAAKVDLEISAVKQS